MYEMYYGKYMQNIVALHSLNKLIKAGKLTQKQVDTMVNDRLEKYGF